MANKDLVRMADDIIKSAEIAEVSYSREVIEKVLHIYEKNFSHSLVPVTFRTTTKKLEKRGLNIRYVDFWTPHDPHAIAISNGLIAKQGHPIDNLFEEIQANYPVMGYGIDFGVLTGFEKIWPFFAPHIPQPVQKAYAMKSLPDSVKKNSDFFTKFNLDNFALFAIDYHNRSTNIYFMTSSIGKFSSEKIAAIIKELDFATPSQELIDYCTNAITFYCTYTWDSPKIERICFGVLAQDQSTIPTHLNPLIEKYSLNAPILSENRKFIYSITFARQGDYIKIENDYSGSMVDLMHMGSPA
ncbi:MAG TPA: aromatic prenyltransferase [Pseudobacteroides sp.]|nr:aromatic prenyltransferase [Pseudobacteroides sp.]